MEVEVDVQKNPKRDRSKHRAKLDQRLATLASRGILRTTSSRPGNIHLGYLDKLIKRTERGLFNGRSYAGCAIHKRPVETQEADRKYEYSLLDPAAARKTGEVLRELAIARGIPKPDKLSTAEKRERHIRKMVAAYVTLDSRGISCTGDVAREQRIVQLKWLRGVINQTETEEGEAGERSFSGLVIHNSSPKRKQMEPTLLDWRVKIGPEGGGKSVSLLAPWMNAYR